MRSFCAGSLFFRCRLQPTWHSRRLSSVQVPPLANGITCSIVAARPAFGWGPSKTIGWPQRQQLSPSRPRTCAKRSFLRRALNAQGGRNQLGDLLFFPAMERNLPRVPYLRVTGPSCRPSVQSTPTSAYPATTNAAAIPAEFASVRPQPIAATSMNG